MEALSTKVLNELFSHGAKWLANLRRAKLKRKRESVQALREVIAASRETAVYVRQLSDKGKRDHDVERRLSSLWTKLGFALEDLDIPKLAKRCQIKGKHWSDPEHYDDAFLKKADVSLEKMERLARELLAEIARG